PPPDQFEDLFEVGRLSRRSGHPASERRIQVSVRTHHSGDNETTTEIDNLVAIPRLKVIATLCDESGLNTQVRLLDGDWIECCDVCTLQKQWHLSLFKTELRLRHCALYPGLHFVSNWKMPTAIGAVSHLLSVSRVNNSGLEF